MARSPGRTGSRWRRARAATLAPDYLLCAICLRPIDKQLTWPHPGSKTAHHLRDLADGGDPLDLANLAPAHLLCNTQAGSRAQAARRARQQSRTATTRQSHAATPKTWVLEGEP